MRENVLKLTHFIVPAFIGVVLRNGQSERADYRRCHRVRDRSVCERVCVCTCTQVAVSHAANYRAVLTSHVIGGPSAKHSAELLRENRMGGGSVLAKNGPTYMRKW